MQFWCLFLEAHERPQTMDTYMQRQEYFTSANLKQTTDLKRMFRQLMKMLQILTEAARGMLQIGICSECDNKLQKKSNMSLHKENLHETANSFALHQFEKETTRSFTHLQWSHKGNRHIAVQQELKHNTNKNNQTNDVAGDGSENAKVV